MTTLPTQDRSAEDRAADSAMQYRELLRYRFAVTVDQRCKRRELRAQHKMAAEKARMERREALKMRRYVQAEARKVGVELDDKLEIVGLPENALARAQGKRLVERLMIEYRRTAHVRSVPKPPQEKPKVVREAPAVPKVSAGVWPPRPKKEPSDLLKYVVTEGGSEPDAETARELSFAEPSSLTVLEELVQSMTAESPKDSGPKKITLTYTQGTDVSGMYRLAGEPVPEGNAQGEFHGAVFGREGAGINERVIRNDLPAGTTSSAEREENGDAAPDSPMGELLWEEVASLEAQVKHWRNECEASQKALHEAHSARRRTEELFVAARREEAVACPQETALTLARLCLNPNLSVTPGEALRTAAELFPNRIAVLPAAYESADKLDRNFRRGGKLLKLLLKLGTEYFDALVGKGDSVARTVFSSSEYSAQESDTVTNGALGRMRDFTYNGETYRMEQHLKIGIASDTSLTLRCYFTWIAGERKFVIGYCGEHLPVASHRT